MVLISKGATWEYQLAANTVPADPSLETVPASGWSSGPGPFGEGGFTINDVPPATAWTRTNGLWIRRYVDLSGFAEVLISGRIEQALYLYWDGAYVGTVNPANAGRTDVPEYRIIIPLDLATSGTHEIALLCLDDNNATGLSYISVEADYLPVVFPLQPQAPITETLEWLTDVTISKDGTEERIKVAVSPRQKFKMNFPAPPEKKRLGHNVLWGDLSNKFMIPVWTQPTILGVVAAGANTIAFDTTESEYRGPGLAILWESFDSWQVIGIESVASGSLTLNTLTKAFSKAWIMPLRYGFIPDGVSKNLDGYKAEFELEIRILDNKELTVSAPTQYNSDDLYTEAGLIEGDGTSDDMVSNPDVFDPGIGLVEFYGTWLNTRIGRTHRVLNEDLSSAWALRQFLHRRAGRYRQFWQPSFEQDLKVKNSGTITTTMSVDRDGYLRSCQNRTHIAVEAAGVWYMREILSVAIVDADTMSLTLDTALGIVASTIDRVSWLGKMRLDTDSVEIRHSTGGVSTSSFRIVEIEP